MQIPFVDLSARRSLIEPRLPYILEFVKYSILQRHCTRLQQPAMESPTERMPIACVHCAKAKAKCDKKVSTPVVEVFWINGQLTYCLYLVHECIDTTPRIRFDSSCTGSLLEMREQAAGLPVEGDTSFFPQSKPSNKSTSPTVGTQSAYGCCFSCITTLFTASEWHSNDT